jgi:hypothetical protein
MGISVGVGVRVSVGVGVGVSVGVGEWVGVAVGEGVEVGWGAFAAQAVRTNNRKRIIRRRGERKRSEMMVFMTGIIHVSGS